MMRAMLRVSIALLFACSSAGPRPLEDVRGEGCASCRMIVSDRRMAAQLVTPGEEAMVFDDIGCLRDWLQAHPAARGAVAFVADHRTGAWLPADRALFVRSTRIRTPMGSQLLAFADAASRDADPAAAGGAAVAAEEVVHR
jgi:copper chaperone NosL